MSELADFERLIAGDHGLCIASTLRPDGTIQSSVVNAGVLKHPVSGENVVGMVVRGGTRKLANLRADPRMTVVVRVGWQWVTVEGSVWIVGPDDPVSGIDGEHLRVLLRAVFTAAGGTHDDWDEYDRVMAEDRRAVVLVIPDRVYGNG
ncbi:TIGR03618 family F420-dependent PPOX class oxidoreductase [Nocardia sp. NBC_01503]|uniref:TIGR03618 family F420-dependent PPOX class oxidoreductase n=1 Tax=Nocardia sp. NBC_01503 TaxID=2975997 RepID=UPI002E7B2983|nr:TIGR03618 family F420-dependent PPOX class oxidoreductase [Nocardia sp. NBC_01503]WTL30793.1 TIGR03618 family F420-dependent PPOX class oxidoreductase [Nocardia sp. NBC_01503]